MGPDRNPRSMGPDKKPHSMGPEAVNRIPDPDWSWPRGTGWRGMEAKESEQSKVEARSKPELYGQASMRTVERGVDVLALTEAPEIERNVVVSSEWILLEERRAGSGRK